MRALLLAFSLELLLLSAGLALTSRTETQRKPMLALAAGVFLWFLAGLALFLAHAPAALWALTALLLAVPGLKHLETLPRSQLLGHATFLTFLLFGESLIRNFGGGFWYADWYEHYERTLFFMNEFPPNLSFQGGYHLTARPPLMNVVMAFPLKVLGAEFWRYQVACVLLNSFVYFPLASITRRHGWLTLLLAANLYVFQNCTYTWTKLLAAFYVLTGLISYYQNRRTLAAASLAAGVLTHYMAAPYFLVTALHALTKPKQALKPALAALLVLSPWLLFAIANFGLQQTLSSNTTSGSFRSQTLKQNAQMVTGNLINTLVPHQLRGGHPDHLKPQMQEPKLPRLRDELFLAAETLPFGIGFGALLMLLITRPPIPRQALLLGIPCFVLSVAVNPGVDPYGTAHIGLAPIILGILALLTDHTPPRLFALLAIDAAAVGLHLYLQAIPPMGQGGATPQNWDLKQQLGLKFLADLSRPWLLIAVLAGLVWQEIRQAPGESHANTEEAECPTTPAARS